MNWTIRLPAEKRKFSVDLPIAYLGLHRDSVPSARDLLLAAVNYASGSSGPTTSVDDISVYLNETWRMRRWFVEDLDNRSFYIEPQMMVLGEDEKFVFKTFSKLTEQTGMVMKFNKKTGELTASKLQGRVVKIPEEVRVKLDELLEKGLAGMNSQLGASDGLGAHVWGGSMGTWNLVEDLGGGKTQPVSRTPAEVHLLLPTKRSTKHTIPMLMVQQRLSHGDGTFESFRAFVPINKLDSTFTMNSERGRWRSPPLNAVKFSDHQGLMVELDRTMQSQPSFKGLGASRAAVESELDVQRGAINTFFTKLHKTKYGASMTDGRFSWDASTIYFDFFGAGKARRITIPMKETTPERMMVLAPSRKDRWLAESTGFPGAAHTAARTTLWERAAWNTVTDFISRLRNAIPWTAKAYARVLTDLEYLYFVNPELTPNLSILTVDRYARTTYYIDPQLYSEAQVRNYLTKEQVDYVLVARDAALERGGQRNAEMPLMGVKR